MLEEIEPGIFDIPLTVSESLQTQKKTLELNLINAQKRLRNFAVQNKWEEYIHTPFAEKAEIYDSQQQFIHALFRIIGADQGTELPETVSAALENSVFLSISPALYNQIYPAGIEEDSFEKLITHEMAHRLHIRILKGDEDAMGPVWFYEGFAIYAADQHVSGTIQSDEIWTITEQKKRGSYRKYGAMIRYFLRKVAINDMVEKAGTPAFHEWLRSNVL